jgi:hypothetical protein
VGFDDLCGLQPYFDFQSVKNEAPPALISAVDFERSGGGRGAGGGRARFAFQTERQLATVRRVLDENWKRIPEQVASASRIDVEVEWAEKAGVRRVVTERDAELIVGRSSWRIPYHVCLSELLYGEALYRRRREVLGLPPASPPLPVAAIAGNLAGGTDGGSNGSTAGAGADGGERAAQPRTAPRSTDARAGDARVD